MYKFRSMHAVEDEQAELMDDVVRTPPFGRRLRSLSLDELPELWNVLRGDMSLVGPRPLMMKYLPRYTAEQMRRHEVRPGITGLTQVSGRNALSWEEKFALDVVYVDHRDLRMDLVILLRTIKVVLRSHGVRHGDESEDDMPEFMGTAVSGGSDGAQP
jgi:lipopolysaccharide/colanic/teichoic acid biosynthesis glycosyltransferase